MVLTRQSHRPPKSRSRAIVTIALLVAIVTAGCAFPEEAFDGSVEGTYYINGFDQQGVEYGGHLTITPTDEPDTYQMQWIITGGIQEGTGTVAGTQLMVKWEAIEGYDAASHGTAVYDISETGELNGERMVEGEEGFGTEEALPIR